MFLVPIYEQGLLFVTTAALLESFLPGASRDCRKQCRSDVMSAGSYSRRLFCLRIP